MDKKYEIDKSQHLSSVEEKIITQKLKFELIDKEYHMLKNASIVSILAALVPVWAVHDEISFIKLASWYVAMFVVHINGILHFLYYKKCHPSAEKLKPWIWTLYLSTFISTLTWGGMGILLVPPSFLGQNVILFFLVVVTSSIALGTATNYITSVFGIVSALFPFISWQFYQGIIKGTSGLYIQTGMMLILYMIFLLIVSYVSYRLLQTSTKLSFVNVALREKLSIANKQLSQTNVILDQRVKERTKELQKANETLEYQATHDELTGLINKDELLTDKINALITLAKNSHTTFALVYFTINNLQEITDNYGVKPDNDAVKEMAERLHEKLVSVQPERYQIIISRRDTFIILIYPVTREQAEEELDRIASFIDEPFSLKENGEIKTIQLKASIGVVMYPANGEEAEKLKMNADLTMSYAKQIAPENTRYIFCSNDTSERMRLESQLKRDFPSAIKHKEFFLVYQPVIDLMTGKVCGMEALVRWQHPQLGLIPPLDFIELSERTGEIVPLGRWILHEGCAQLKAWHDAGYTSLIMAINLSAKQLESSTLVEDVKRILQETHLPAQFLELEMTETAKFGADAVKIFQEFDRMGISIALDDFGQGQSGLNSLQQFDFIKKIKFDRAFIKDLPNNERSKKIIVNSINLVRSLSKSTRKITVLGEGVDKPEQLSFLKAQGVDMVQGFYFSKPIPTAEFEKFLKEHPKFEV